LLKSSYRSAGTVTWVSYWVSTLVYPNLLGLTGYVDVDVSFLNEHHRNTFFIINFDGSSSGSNTKLHPWSIHKQSFYTQKKMHLCIKIKQTREYTKAFIFVQIRKNQ